MEELLDEFAKATQAKKAIEAFAEILKIMKEKEISAEEMKKGIKLFNAIYD